MKKKNRYVYPAILTYEDKGKIAITFPDLPGCASCGETDDEAIDCGREALGGHLWVMERDGDEIPEPSSLNTLKLDENEVAVLIDVHMQPIRLAQENRSVSRTITLPAWMNARAVEQGVNFSQALRKRWPTITNPQIIQPEKRNEVRPSAEPPNPCGAEMRYVSAPAFLCTGNAGFFNHSKIFCLCNLLQFPTLFDDFLRFHELSAVRNIGCVAYNEIIGFAGYRCPDQRADR